MSRCCWFPDKANFIFVGFRFSGLLVLLLIYVGFRQAMVQCVGCQFFGDKWKIWSIDKTLFYLWKAKVFISLFDFAQKQGSSYSQRKALAPKASDFSNLSALLKRRLDKKTTWNFIIENFRPPTILTDAVKSDLNSLQLLYWIAI